MGKNEFARAVTGSDSGYGDDVSERNSSSPLHPLCKSRAFVLQEKPLCSARCLPKHVLTSTTGSPERI